MINLEDSFKLAKTKFKTRKLRNIFSGCTISLGIIIIMVILLGTSGVLSFVKSAFIDSLSGRYFSVEDPLYVSMPKTFDAGSGVPESITKEKYAEQNKNFNFKNLYEKKVLYGRISIDVPIENKTMLDAKFDFAQLTYQSLDELFVKDLLVGKNTFGDNYGGAIPIIVPRSVLINMETNDVSVSSKKSYELTQTLIEKYIGKTYSLQEVISDTNTEDTYPNVYTVKKKTLDTRVIIVGFSNDGSIFGYDALNTMYSVILPSWAMEKNDDLKRLSSDVPTNYIAEFNSKSDLEKFVKEKQFNVATLTGKFEMFQEIITQIRNVGLGVGGFFLLISALFILSTLGKIVADSKKEIGVFRAVGAQKGDIKKIFFSYSILLTSLGFLIGVFVALLFNIVLSQLWGEEFFYNIAIMSTTFNFSKPLFMFVGFPLLEVVGLYVATIAVGFVATYFPARSASNVDPIIALREG